MVTTTESAAIERADSESTSSEAAPASAPQLTEAAPARRKHWWGFLLLFILGLAGSSCYALGIFPTGKSTPSPADRAKAEKAENDTARAVPAGLALVPGKPNTLEVPEEVCDALGIRKGHVDSLSTVRVPDSMPPLVLSGWTALDPTRLARVKARFAPARVVQLGQVWDRSAKTGHTEYRELRPGDSVSKGDLLGVFYSADVGSKKNDLLDALVQLELDQKILDDAEKHVGAVPDVFLLTYQRAVQGDRNAINRALNNLKVWDIPQSEIDDLHTEAKKISADQNAWLKTPEGRWVKGESQSPGNKPGAEKEAENPWGRVTLRAPFDGVIVERNVHVDEMVVDNTVNLFQVADVNRLLVVVSCPEDALPILEGLSAGDKRWIVRTVGAEATNGLPGTIDEIGYLIDPNQHTAVIKGYVENPGKRIRAGQFVSATVRIPPPEGVVEIPADALIDDGQQSLVFVQPEPNTHRYAMRRVQVTHRFEHTVFVRSTPIPPSERRTAQEAADGLLSREPLRAGEVVLTAGSLELKAVVQDLQSREGKAHSDHAVGATAGLARPSKSVH